MNEAIRFDAVDVLFARRSGRAGRADVRRALDACDAGDAPDAVLATHGVVVAVRDVSLVVPEGAITVLVGPSGSGKSTLLRTANGLTRPTRGAVHVRDGASTVDVTHCSDATLRHVRRHRVSMVFQQFGLLPSRSVRDNVGFGLELRGDDAASRRATVDAHLALVGLVEWADRPVGELSGGMQQRVGLARALATGADILLMDEPFSALDALTRRRLQEELRVLQAHVRRTILFVTHDLEEATWLGDQLAVMHAGRVVQVGTPEVVVQAPATEDVAALVHCLRPRTRGRRSDER